MQMPAAVQTDNAAKIPYYEHSGVQSLKLYRTSSIYCTIRNR